MAKVYLTKQDVIELVITPGLGEYLDDHNVDGIFDDAYRYDEASGGFVIAVDTPDEFWSIVERHRKASK
jgi:hypothetical protein